MSLNQNYAQAAAQGIEPMQPPRGAFTGRIRMLADQSEEIRARLYRVMNNLRVAPPAPAEMTGKDGRQSCVEDYLQRNESANETIGGLLNELEGLFQ